MSLLTCRVSTSATTVSILRQHDHGKVIGFTDETQKLFQLRLSGNIVEDTEAGREVVLLADSGFVWQASIGFVVQEVESLPEGKTSMVNGGLRSGPLQIVPQE